MSRRFARPINAMSARKFRAQSVKWRMREKLVAGIESRHYFERHRRRSIKMHNNQLPGALSSMVPEGTFLDSSMPGWRGYIPGEINIEHNHPAMTVLRQPKTQYQ